MSLWRHLSFICMTRVRQIWIFVKFLTRQMRKAHIDLSIKIPLGRGEEIVPYWLVKPEPGWREEELGQAIVRGWLRVCAWKGCQLVLGFAPASITTPWILGAQYYHPLNTWSTVLPSPWILGPQCCVPPWILGPRDTLARIHQFLQLKRRGAGGWGLWLISFNTDEEIESKLAFKQRLSLILIILNT